MLPVGALLKVVLYALTYDAVHSLHLASLPFFREHLALLKPGAALTAIKNCMLGRVSRLLHCGSDVICNLVICCDEL